ncbi:MAG: FAD-dependent oxidoreductase [Myxococcales bacterium]|nr:FAD-dependent oxidoreductase [Myxococcales bacterium]
MSRSRASRADVIHASRGDVVVIGAGVIGLSSAACLLEAGYRVRVCAQSLPPALTSCVAAAFWYPFNVFPEQRVRVWADTSYRVFTELARVPETGVRVAPALELLPGPSAPPSWSAVIPDYRAVGPSSLPAGYRDGFAFSSFVIETPIYLPWLLRRVIELGGELETRTLASLDDAPACDLLVNCAGLGSGALVGDAAVVPVRGQLVRVENTGVERVTVDEHGPGGAITYIVPRSRDVVLGGTAERGSTRLEPDSEATAQILARCRALEPRLARARVLGVDVGLRPCRDELRLELERGRSGAPVLHNYGHGGAGVTLSWGCARELVELADATLGRSLRAHSLEGARRCSGRAGR